MVYPKIDITKAYKIGLSNSTTSVREFRLGKENTLIAIENIAMFSGEVFLRDVPSRRKALPKSDVMASLERSLKKHASVWGELSKH